jgi:hypothetical protein
MIERRFAKGALVRAKNDGHIEGHAAVFDEEYVLWDSGNYRVVESIKPGTFKRALKEKQDVRGLVNHDSNQVIGRTAAGTLSLKEDQQGLYFDCEPPDTQTGRDVRTLIQRGDISGCSFAFSVTKEVVTEEKKGTQTIRRREIQDVDLYDVGPVTYPAYSGTDVSARSLEMRSLLFPGGVPASVLELVPELRAKDDNEEEDCRCGCRACMSAECDECEMHMASCGDQERCDHMSDARSARGDKKTKRVAGEDLTASCFLYVGDAADPSTWALPWKFSSEAKTKSHLRNALARFNQTKKIPSDKKAGVWKRLARLCKKYGIAVSDDQSKSLGLTAEQRATIGGGIDCQCDCPECLVGDCEHCSDPDCEDPDCDHPGADDDGDRAAALDEIDLRMRVAGMKWPA